MEYRSQKERETIANESHLVCPDYWARKCAGGECCTEIRRALDQTPYRTAAAETHRREYPSGVNCLLAMSREVLTTEAETPRDNAARSRVKE
jgi:hypothetical protein